MQVVLPFAGVTPGRCRRHGIPYASFRARCCSGFHRCGPCAAGTCTGGIGRYRRRSRAAVRLLAVCCENTVRFCTLVRAVITGAAVPFHQRGYPCSISRRHCRVPDSTVTGLRSGRYSLPRSECSSRRSRLPGRRAVRRSTVRCRFRLRIPHRIPSQWHFHALFGLRSGCRSSNCCEWMK